MLPHLVYLCDKDDYDWYPLKMNDSSIFYPDLLRVSFVKIVFLLPEVDFLFLASE